jgi:hypothetical protein
MKPVKIIIGQLENRTDNLAKRLAGNSRSALKNNPILQISMRAVQTPQNTENRQIMQRMFRLSWIKIRKTINFNSNPNLKPSRKSP